MRKGFNDVFKECELLEIAKKLIEIDSSTACVRRERDVADWLLTLFSREGIPCRLQEIEDGRGNVIAVLRGSGTGKSLMLNGHMDTVPAGNMEHPFKAEIRDGFLWGRGATDMKGGLAAMAYALILLHRMDLPLKGDVVFAGVIDEEAAKSTGSRFLAEHGPKTDYAIVGEPTELHPVIAHKGIDYFAVHFHGRAAHSSNPQNGIHAVYAASEYALQVKNRLVPEYQKKVHPFVGSPTVNLGLIRGCAEANAGFITGASKTFAGIVPDQCSLWLDIRWIPGQTIDGIMEDLRNLGQPVALQYPGLTIEVEYIRLPRPAMELSPDDPLALAASKWAAYYDPAAGELQGAPYFADSGILYGVGGIRSMILGPGSIESAHAEDERAEICQIVNASKIYAGIAEEICGS